MNEEPGQPCSPIDPVAAFKALGDPTRFRIFQFLRSCCCPVAVEDSGDVRPVDGPTVGEVCCSVTGAGQITSTVSRHLKELKLAGLITVERRGKNMICGVNPQALSELTHYFDDSAVLAPGERAGCGGCC
jgi:ArsR family transcriptional regulator